MIGLTMVDRIIRGSSPGGLEQAAVVVPVLTLGNGTSDLSISAA